ncbi:MAG: retron St85 family RNA-directed DNA polymerase [Bdellovibrionaceae bacterium]|nr:retron St85 family RNA-directed DNA polymerase [Pseudobdellovibrionaceae bacterium]
MSIKFNDQLLFYGLGVIQPATPFEVIEFLRLIYPDITQWPDEEMLNQTFSEWLRLHYVIILNKEYHLLSLTSVANLRMDWKLRKLRDKARLTLLRELYDASLNRSEVAKQDLDGDSPSSESSTISQEGTRPVNSGSAPSRLTSTRHSPRIYWPRVVEQLNFKVGLGSQTSDIPFYRFRYCSFPNLRLLQEASSDSPLERDMSLSQLALAIGISPRLLTSFIHKPGNHYRFFDISKKGGGKRQIASPRFFLKTVQYWIKSYILCHLKIHDSCHAYLVDKSIITNAEKHVGKEFLANIDIEDFFGSIKTDHVFQLLRKNEIGERLSRVVAHLITLDGKLPQGVPTSPTISNAFLYEFDNSLTKISREAGLEYSRYADDITISGSSRLAIESVISKCRTLLLGYGLKLNENKTRIATSHSSQRVTGLVVNEKIQPPREFQRRVRAIFHRVNKKPEIYIERISELRGYYSYLSSFNAIKDSRHLQRYRMVINKLKAVARNNRSSLK